jgi:hypothetical protein
MKHVELSNHVYPSQSQDIISRNTKKVLLEDVTIRNLDYISNHSLCQQFVLKKKKKKKISFKKVELTPKIPQDQKLVDCCLGSFCEEKYIF